MTLDEAIKYTEEATERYRSDAHIYYDIAVFKRSIKHDTEAEICEQECEKCKECAKEYRQLVNLLKDYKRLKEQQPCDDCISRQAAIVQLSHNKIGDDDCDVIIQKDIETIKALAPVTPRPCDDTISRQAAIDAIYARYIGGKEAVDKAPASDHYAEGIDEAVCAVEDLPPVTQKSETVTEFADRCRECGAKYGKLLKQRSCTDAISRQEAIDKMQELEDEDIKAYSCKIPEGFDGKRAIEALKAFVQSVVSIEIFIFVLEVLTK